MQTIIVDMTPGFRMPTIYYSQGDVGTQFAIDLRSRFGDSFPTGTTVTIQATKPSGFGFSVAATSVTNGVATFTTTAEMTDEFGRFPAELKVTKTGLTLFSANFYMDGEENTHPDGTIDGQQETVIPELAQLVERVEDAASSVLDMTVNATTLAAGSQATYSYDEETNTATFGIPQGEAGAGAAGVVASAYSASSTYAVGDYVIHNSNLYRCTTAITTAEAFTAAHWTQVVLADDVSDLKSDLSNEIALTWIDNKFINNNGYASSDNAYACTDYANIENLSAIGVITAMGNDSSRLAFYNSGKTLISGSQVNLNASAPKRFNLTVPTGACFFRMSFKKSLGDYATDGKAFASGLYSLISKIPSDEEDIKNLQSEATKLPEYTNLIDPSKVVSGGYIKDDGTWGTGSSDYNGIQNYIRLKANTTYYFEGINGTRYYAFYNDSYTKFDGSAFITLASVESHYGFVGSITPNVDCYFRGSLSSGSWNTQPYLSGYYDRYTAFGTVDYSILSKENTDDIAENTESIGNIQRLVSGSVICKRFYNLYAVNISVGGNFFTETEGGENFSVGYLNLYDKDKQLLGSVALTRTTPASSRNNTNETGSIIRYVELSKGTLQNVIVTYGDNIIQTIDKKIQDAQLRPTTVVAENGSKFLDGCPPKQRAIVTFIDDDGHADVYTRLYPIFHNKGQKFGSAIITGVVGSANRITLAQLTECVESGTLETLSHTVDVSTNLLDGYTDSEIEYQLRESKAWLDEHDFNSDAFVYPQGTSDKNVRDMVRKYYMAGYATTATWNGADGYIDNYGIARIHLLTFTTSNPAISGIDNVDSIEYYKACVDKAVTDNTWLVFMTHIGQHESSRDSIISSLIDYITGLGVPILSPSEAFAERRNVIDVGDSSSRHMWVGNDGYYNSFASHMYDATNATKSVGNYVKNTVTLQAISRPEGNLGGFPTRHGWLETFRAPSWEGLSMQRFTSYQDNGKVYIRFYNTSTSDWGSWLEP